MSAPRPPLRLLTELVRIDEDAKRDQESIPIAEALEGPLEDRWRRLVDEARATLAEQPS